MLFDPGPLSPIDESQFPRVEWTPTLADAAASLVGGLSVTDGALSASSDALVGAAASQIAVSGAADLADAADAHDQQSRDFDTSVGTIAGNADAQSSEIAGLMSESASDIVEGEGIEAPGYVEHAVPRPGADPNAPPPTPRTPPAQPTPPPREGSAVPRDGAPPPPPSDDDTRRATIAGYYRELLGRDGSNGEIQDWMDTGLSLDEIRAGFLGSQEYQEKHPEG